MYARAAVRLPVFALLAASFALALSGSALVAGCDDESGGGGAGSDGGACDPTALACNTAPAPDGGAACALPFVGDPCAPMELELVYFDVDQANHPLVAGAEVPLICPPQGGRVMFLGVRAKNVDPCGVSLTGALRDVDSNAVRVEQRIVNLTPTADGWVETSPGDISRYANVPVCPNQWTDKTIYEADFRVEVVLQDRCGNVGQAEELIRPACSEPGHQGECQCLCRGGYVLGEPCPEAQGEEPCGATLGEGGAGGAGGGP